MRLAPRPLAKSSPGCFWPNELRGGFGKNEAISIEGIPGVAGVVACGLETAGVGRDAGEDACYPGLPLQPHHLPGPQRQVGAQVMALAGYEVEHARGVRRKSRAGDGLRPVGEIGEDEHARPLPWPEIAEDMVVVGREPGDCVAGEFRRLPAQGDEMFQPGEDAAGIA